MSNEVWTEVYDRLAELVDARTAPRSSSSTPGAWPSGVARHLAERLGERAGDARTTAACRGNTGSTPSSG